MITPLMSSAVQAIRSVESDLSSDTDQEMFYPYYSVVEGVYTMANIGLAPQDRYKRLMGSCTTQENVYDFNMC